MPRKILRDWVLEFAFAQFDLGPEQVKPSIPYLKLTNSIPSPFRHIFLKYYKEHSTALSISAKRMLVKLTERYIKSQSK